jgi:phosphotransferase system HPr-like phosphotransfer protein
MNTSHDALTYNINLKTHDNAVKFVNMINTLNGYFDISVGNYHVDAKSLLGVLSMDPSRTVTLYVVSNEHSTAELNEMLKPFCA